jgi:hypothetical protein
MSEAAAATTEVTADTSEGVTAPGQMKVSAADESVTFDDMFEMESQKIETVPEMKKAAKAKQKKEEAEGEALEKTSVPVESGKKANSKKETEEGSDGDSGSEEPDEKIAAKEKEAEKEKPKANPIKAKAGDSELDLDPETLVPVKINGEETEVPLSELRNNYSGKVVYEKKFSELEGQRRSFEKEKTSLTTSVKAIFNKAQEDPEGAFYEMAEQFGYDPVKLRQDFYDAVRPQIEKWSQLSEDERQALDLKAKNEYLQKRLESVQTKTEQEKSQRELDKKVQSLQEAHQITGDEFQGTFSKLEELQSAGTLKVENITPEFVAEVIVKERLVNSLTGQFDELAPKVDVETREKQAIQFIDKASRLGMTPQQTEAAFQDYIQEAYRVKRSKVLSRKVEDMEDKEELEKSPSSRTARSPINEPVFFDDI